MLHMDKMVWCADQGELGEDEFRSHFAQFGDIEDSVVRVSGEGSFAFSRSNLLRVPAHSLLHHQGQ